MHQPILVKEAVEFFEGSALHVFYEGTLGAGGHAKAFLEAHPEIKQYIGCDRDPQAIEIARATLSAWSGKVFFIQDDFVHLDHHLGEYGIEAVDGFFLT